jgi:hypothetical protein
VTGKLHQRKCRDMGACDLGAAFETAQSNIDPCNQEQCADMRRCACIEGRDDRKPLF